MTHRHLSRAVALALLAASGSAAAITDVENNASIPFSFSNPGARSLAMGGAFLALADDATAAYTNPAGLTGLGIDQQLGVEFRHSAYSDEYASGGSASADASDLSGVGYRRANSSVNNLSFLSWVLPRDNWALALYRHELVNYNNSYTTQPIAIGNQGAFVFPYAPRTDLEIVNYGASFGYKVNDTLSIGAGLSWYDFDIDTSVARYDTRFGAVGSNDALANLQSQNGNDDDIGYNLGILFRGSDNFSIGVSYRSAPEFEYRATNIAGNAAFADLFGTDGVFTGQTLADKTARFKAPDMLGIGFNWRASDQLSLSLDLNHINYSNLTESMQTAFLNDPGDGLTVVTQIPLVGPDGTIPAGTAIPDLAAGPTGVEAAQSLRIEDQFEPHFGMEYAFADRPLYLRAGAWLEKRHTVHHTGSAILSDGTTNANAVLFSTGSNEMHFSLGMGWVFEKFQIDAATDQSDRGDIYSVSGVWRF